MLLIVDALEEIDQKQANSEDCRIVTASFHCTVRVFECGPGQANMLPSVCLANMLAASGGINDVTVANSNTNTSSSRQRWLRRQIPIAH